MQQRPLSMVARSTQLALGNVLQYVLKHVGGSGKILHSCTYRTGALIDGSQYSASLLPVGRPLLPAAAVGGGKLSRR